MEPTTRTTPTVLVLPGWRGSGPEHWQSRWEARHGCVRVEQHDWQRPLRGDWTVRLEDVASAIDGPLAFAAHSLGCHLLTWWAQHTHHAPRVVGALLVAPPDVERADVRERLPGWAPATRASLPFRATVVSSSDDPYATAERTAVLAHRWGAALYSVGARGHVNADSGLGDWDEGYALLSALWR